jgi:hypothetical protein
MIGGLLLLIMAVFDHLDCIGVKLVGKSRPRKHWKVKDIADDRIVRLHSRS